MSGKNQLAKNTCEPKTFGGRMCPGIKGRTEGWLGVRLGYFIDALRGEGQNLKDPPSLRFLNTVHLLWVS
jgi:hypothetical protein